MNGFYGEDFSVEIKETPEHISGYRTFGDFFKTFSVQPALGRAFSLDESRGTGARVAVITDTLWKHRFSADHAVIGRHI